MKGGQTEEGSVSNGLAAVHQRDKEGWNNCACVCW